jgi:hypothetical protein
VVLLGILAAWAIGVWRDGRREARFLMGAGAAAFVLALGSGLKVTGLMTILLPWWPFAHLPVIRYILAYRFMAYVTLAVAIAVALWLAQPGRRPRWRWALALVAVAMLLPTAGRSFYHEQPIPAFFTDGAWRQVLRPGDRVFALPYGVYGPSMVWNEATGYGFELVGGYFEPPPEGYEAPVIQELSRASTFSPSRTDELRAFLRAKGATVVVVDATTPGPGLDVLRGLGLHGTEHDGVIVARLD